jgi:hypothetical protein
MTVKLTSSLLLSLLLAGCAAPQVARNLIDPGALSAFTRGKIDSLGNQSPFLKAHMKNGDLYLFDIWIRDPDGVSVTGHARLFNSRRDTLANGPFTVGCDSVAIFETNVITHTGSQGALTLFTGLTAGITALCVINPKACFGSCPTFYVSDGDSARLEAEGFSSSISPALEATDVDALYRAHPSGGRLSVDMKNEALETHVVRHVDLLAVPRTKGSRVFADDRNGYWECSSLTAPHSAQGPEGDCRVPLRSMDGIERLSLSDPDYLGAKETINLTFYATPGRTYGLVIGCRQSLLPTYLLYQTFAYMGSAAGHWIAEIERHNLRKSPGGMEDLIGGIDAEVLEGGNRWRPIGGVREHGPLATDVHLLLTGPLADSTTIRIRMTKGAWRIDYAALAELSHPVAPIRVHPRAVFKAGVKDDDALDCLIDSTRRLVTLPGERYTLEYDMPDGHESYELFLESRGYYLEWIRKEWIAEENPLLLAEIFMDPESALRRMAPEFKRVEPQMEESFWRSRYANP